MLNTLVTAIVLPSSPTRPPLKQWRWWTAPAPWAPSMARELLDLIDRVRGVEAQLARLKAERP